jgi:hypothetical protein
MKKLPTLMLAGVTVTALWMPSAVRPQRDAGYPVVSGVLVDRAGNAIRGHVWVFFSIPGLTASQGATPTPLLGRTMTDAAGRFVISTAKLSFVPFASSSALARQVTRGIRRNGGWANLDVVVSDGKTVRYRSISRRIVADAAFLSRRGGSGLGIVTLAGGLPGAMRARPTGVAPCIDTVTAIGEPTKRPTVIGELHAAGDSSEKLTYGQTADSEIDVGFSSAGRLGLAGSVHVANSQSVIQTWSSGKGNGRHALANFEYQRYRHQLTGACGRASFSVVKATTWDLGVSFGAIANDPSDQCRRPPYATRWRDSFPPDPVDGFTRSAYGAIKYSAAVTLFGFHLGASSGYSKSVTLSWSPGTMHQQYYACGDNADPARAGRVFTGFSD